MLAKPARASAAASSNRLAAGSIELWLFNMADPKFLEGADAGPTSTEEQERATALRSPLAGRQLLARRAALRGILSEYLGIDSAAVRLLVAPGGKPVLTHGPAFSSAHSADLFAVAIAGSSSIGLDVEHRRLVSGGQTIAERWFSEQEARALADGTDRQSTATSENSHSDAFLRLWCAKEALAKRHGAGIRLMKRGSGDVGGPLHVGAALQSDELRYVDASPGHVLAIASSTPIQSVTLRQLPA